MSDFSYKENFTCTHMLGDDCLTVTVTGEADR